MEVDGDRSAGGNVLSLHQPDEQAFPARVGRDDDSVSDDARFSTLIHSGGQRL